jgi:hypothetical protein
MICSRSNDDEAKSIHHGGGLMKRSNVSGRSLASLVMLLGATFTILLLPAYAQQEVTPSWYDPWAAPSAAAIAHAAQPPAVVLTSQMPVTAPRHQQTAKSQSPAPHARTIGVKYTPLDQSAPKASRKTAVTQSGN